MGKNHPMKNRRAVLKLTAGAAGTTLFTGINSGKSVNKLAGTTYDTLTHKTGQSTTGRIKRSSADGLEGQLMIGGYQFSMDEVNQVNTSEFGDRHAGVFTEPRYMEDETPIKLDFFHHSDQLSGYITRKGEKYGKLGFMLFKESNPRAGNAEKIITPAKRWKESDQSFEIPDKGIPTDSGIGQIMKNLDKKPKGEEKDGR